MNNTYSQEQLQRLEQKAGQKLEALLLYFGLGDLKKTSRFYVGPCPIHLGDKLNAFNIFHTGYSTIGNWRCFTHNCHQIFKPTIIGFVRGIISNRKYNWRHEIDKNKECPFPEAIEFLIKFCKEDLSIPVDYDETIEMKKFIAQMNIYHHQKATAVKYKIPRSNVVQALDIPAQYYISRGYSAGILTKYDVGLCAAKGREMYMRVTVPIYDEDHQYMIACTGRTIFNKCALCNSYHNPINPCPDTKNLWKYSKWLHSHGFRGESCLYNYWFAKEHIAKTGIAIIVEGPGDVWRLEEAGIHCAIGTFGAHLTSGQRAILDKSGALSLIVLTDPDEAGKLAAADIKKTCQNTYNLYFPSIGNTDIGDTNTNVLQDKLLPIIEKIQGEYKECGM